MWKSCTKNWKTYATCGLLPENDETEQNFDKSSKISKSIEKLPLPETKITPFEIFWHIKENSAENKHRDTGDTTRPNSGTEKNDQHFFDHFRPEYGQYLGSRLQILA